MIIKIMNKPISIKQSVGILVLALGLSIMLVSANASADDRDPHRLPSDHLPNLVWVHPNVLSGGLPEGDAAFAELAQRGIRTLISVDGMTPDVDMAAKYGLRYVHIPHGYDGVPAALNLSLAKAVRDLPGPIYIHCHHGKHRSPAAASVACVAAGLLPPESAETVLTVAGTDPNYRGLFQAARDAVPIDPGRLDSLAISFDSIATIPPMAQAMVNLEATYHHMRLIAESGWKSPTEHPDLDPVHEALLLREHFAELRRGESTEEAPQPYRPLFQKSQSSAETLRDALESMKTNASDKTFSTDATRHLNLIGEQCKACHVRYRDTPQ